MTHRTQKIENTCPPTTMIEQYVQALLFSGCIRAQGESHSCCPTIFPRCLSMMMAYLHYCGLFPPSLSCILLFYNSIGYAGPLETIEPGESDIGECIPCVIRLNTPSVMFGRGDALPKNGVCLMSEIGSLQKTQFNVSRSTFSNRTNKFPLLAWFLCPVLANGVSPRYLQKACGNKARKSVEQWLPVAPDRLQLEKRHAS